MRYFTQDDIVFTNRNGKSFTLKEIREFPKYVTMAILQIQGASSLDEIASREEVYGDDMESQSYKIFEHNAKDIVNAGFDLTKLTTLRIPMEQ